MRRWPAIAGVAGAVLATLCAWLPASAAAARPAVPLSADNFNSANQAGYFDYATGSLTIVDSFKVPTVTCTSTTLQAVMDSALLFRPSGLSNGAGVIVSCTDGSPAYAGALLVSDSVTYTNFVPNPGDTILASASVSATSTTVEVKDATQKVSQTATAAGAANSLAFWGVESLLSNGVPLPVPAFTKTRFSKGTLNGATVKASGGTAVDLMETSVVDVHTGTLSITGNSWTETFRNSG
jgi:hypothetical protein